MNLCYIFTCTVSSHCMLNVLCTEGMPFRELYGMVVSYVKISHINGFPEFMFGFMKWPFPPCHCVLFISLTSCWQYTEQLIGDINDPRVKPRPVLNRRRTLVKEIPGCIQIHLTVKTLNLLIGLLQIFLYKLVHYWIYTYKEAQHRVTKQYIYENKKTALHKIVL